MATAYLGYRHDLVSSRGKCRLSFGRRKCLPDQESVPIGTGEYPWRAVGGDRPAPTRVWSRFLPRQEPASRLPRTETLSGQKAWIGSSTVSISSSCAQALATRRGWLTS